MKTFKHENHYSKQQNAEKNHFTAIIPWRIDSLKFKNWNLISQNQASTVQLAVLYMKLSVMIDIRDISEKPERSLKRRSIAIYRQHIRPPVHEKKKSKNIPSHVQRKYLKLFLS